MSETIKVETTKDASGKNILEIKNMHTWFHMDSGIVNTSRGQRAQDKSFRPGRPGAQRWYSKSRLYRLTRSPSLIPISSRRSNSPAERSIRSNQLRDS